MKGPSRIQFNLLLPSIIVLVILVVAQTALAQGTTFTYQGRLVEAGNPANGTYDMQFKLFDTATLGTGIQQGSTLPKPNVMVTAGGFTVLLDFGASVFDGSERYLEIGVRPAGSPNPYTVLGPRTQITSSPYAINTQQLGGVPASRYVKAEANGNVAIGPGVPAHRLAVLGGPPWTGDGWGGALELENASAIAWRANTSNVKFGIGRTENGLFFFRTNSPLGTTTNGPIYDFKMDNDSNVGIGQIGISTDLTGAKLNLFTTSLQGYGLVQTENSSGVSIGTFIGGGVGSFGTRSNHRLGFFVNNGFPKMMVYTTGNVGIGTFGISDAVTKLDVRGDLTLDSGTSPALYTAAAGGEQNRYLSLLNSPSFQSASGLKAGGVLVSDNFFYANPGKSDLIVKGNVGIGTPSPTAKLHVVGTAKTSVLEITGGADLAEHFEIVEEETRPGMVVAIDPQQTGKLTLARGAYNRRVAGVISGANNLSAGMVLPNVKESNNSRPIALSGRVWVYCDASGNPIRPGDLLTTSNTPGHAMKVRNYARAQGAIIGKAMTGLKSGYGLVLVLVSLQ